MGNVGALIGKVEVKEGQLFDWGTYLKTYGTDAAEITTKNKDLAEI